MGEGTGPEDGAEEAAGVVRPESLGGGFGVLPAAAGGAAAAAAAAGAASALLLVVGGGGGAEEDGLVDRSLLLYFIHMFKCNVIPVQHLQLHCGLMTCRYILQWESKHIIAVSTAIQDWLTSSNVSKFVHLVCTTANAFD